MIYRMTRESDFLQLAEMRWIHIEEDEDEPDLSEFDKTEFIDEFCSFLKTEIGANYFCFVADDNNKIVSNIYLGILNKTPKPSILNNNSKSIGYITNVHTLKDYRNIGVGSKLMNFVKENAKANRCELLFVWPSEQAIPYYERLGFKNENDIMEYII